MGGIAGNALVGDNLSLGGIHQRAIRTEGRGGVHKEARVVVDSGVRTPDDLVLAKQEARVEGEGEGAGGGTTLSDG